MGVSGRIIDQNGISSYSRSSTSIPVTPPARLGPGLSLPRRTRVRSWRGIKTKLSRADSARDRPILSHICLTREAKCRTIDLWYYA